MYWNTRAKYLVDRVRAWPTDSGLLTHVNHPAANVTLPTLTQKSTCRRPPRRKKRNQDFRWQNFIKEILRICLLYMKPKPHNKSPELQFSRPIYKTYGPKPATIFNKEPVASQCTRDRDFSLLPLFLLRPKFLREFFRDKISQLEARFIKKMALTPELVST